MQPVPALSLAGVSKTFESVRALRGLDLEVDAGTIHTLLGANGSGKSTLIKILSGYHSPDPGAEIRVWGRPVGTMQRPSDHGIALVHQDLGLLEEGTVLENIGISSGYSPGRCGRISWGGERRRARAALESQGIELDLDALVSSLEPAERTAVGIARAIRQIDEQGDRPHILLLDEPTVALGPADVERLFALMRRISGAGGAVIFVTHRLKEALAISDRITVLRDGELVASHAAGEASADDLLHDMHGPEQAALDNAHAAREAGVRERSPVLAVEGLSGSTVRGFTSTWCAGEVIGVTGLAGMGHDELPYLLMGSKRAREGRVELAGRDLSGCGPSEAWTAGLALVPANRQQQAIWQDGSVAENFTIGRLGEYYRGGLLQRRGELRATEQAIESFDVRPPLPGARIGVLSGGNQQKLVLGRALAGAPRVLLLHEPFIGIDAAAREATVRTIDRVASEGCCVAIFSLEYDLVTQACDRVLVLSHGQLVAELSSDLTTNSIIKAAQA